MVHVGVLHTEHWRVGLLFLKAGKNVLCEKPFAMNSRQVKDLVATAKNNNVFLMELHIPRSVEKELGSGALLDIGVYCLQFVLMVFNGERSESIQATGVLLDSGVDESVVVVKFSRNRVAFCTFSIAVRLPNDAVICRH
ncbi:hypothetical protein CesoFtcFv8_000645 [Champsocephalus esox]|uniref:Trans-1,2-dihydrobenzene-1,2-diol dehydrogenase n=1 Tax=Champsocephalus esox TaxID=159716 RepID=A0AAN8D5P4_9TELE|nr:hypothetical protein CesoFtcFv8_000645 [Champsocephalus esox]